MYIYFREKISADIRTENQSTNSCWLWRDPSILETIPCILTNGESLPTLLAVAFTTVFIVIPVSHLKIEWGAFFMCPCKQIRSFQQHVDADSVRRAAIVYTSSLFLLYLSQFSFFTPLFFFANEGIHMFTKQIQCSCT